MVSRGLLVGATTLLLTIRCGGGKDGTGQGGPPPAPPTIISQPATALVSVCGDLVLRVVATGTPPLTYQWLRDGIPIPGATGATYQVIGAVQADSGSYVAAVSNAWGTTTTVGASLTVTGSPPAATAPVVLAEEYAGQIAVTGNSVAWTTFVGVHAAPLPCGRPVRSIYERSSYDERTDGIVLTPSQVVWTDASLGGIWVAPLGGGPATKLADLGSPGPFQIALSGDQLWWPRLQIGVQSMSLAGGQVATFTYGVPGAIEADGIAVDDQYVYWNDLAQRTVNRMPLVGGPVLVLADSQHYLGGVAADGHHVYWADTDESTNPPTGRVYSVSRDGGSATVLATQTTHPLVLAVDGSHVYWTSDLLNGPPGSYSGSGSVAKARLDGTEAPVILAAGINPYGIAVDAQRVYWVEGGPAVGPARVVMLAK